jgi:predicted dehydrogenase
MITSPMTKRLSRRVFLGKGLAAGAVLALPVIVPASVFGEDAPSNRITLGIIGTGEQGILNLRGLIGKQGCQIITVCDVDLNHREEARKRLKLPPESSYVDFREVLNRDDVDAVFVCTPDHWHALISIAAMKAGKDVYCEKPLTYCVAEGKALCDAVRRYGRILQTGSQQRSDKNFRLACELVRNGRIGKLHTIKVELPENSRPNPLAWKVESPPARLDYDLWVGPSQYRPYIEQACHYNWHFIYDFSWGQLSNWGPHALDIAQWGNGTDLTGPVEVSGTAKFPHEGLFETPLSYDLEYKYANGVRLLCTTRDKPDGSESPVRFEGTEGWIYVSRNRFFSQPESIVQSRIGSDEIRLYRSIAHQQNFLDCVKSQSKPAAEVEIGHRSATVCHLGSIAVRLGRKLRWDPAKEQFIDDEQADRMLSRPMRSPWSL